MDQHTQKAAYGAQRAVGVGVQLEQVIAGRSSEVPEQVGRLSGAVAMASELLDALEQRLSSVYRGTPMGSEPRGGGLNQAVPESVLVPLAGDLRSISRNVDLINTRLQGILNGVEL